jgi:dienelactone hydrolase
LFVGVALLLLAIASNALAPPTKDDVTLKKTPDGVEYGVWGQNPPKPAPTLILLSGNIVDSFTKPNFLQAGKYLAPHGFLFVSIDLPCHGTQAKKGLSNLTGWAKRAAAGDDFVAEFNDRMSKMIDHLIAEGLSDPNKIAISGTSRGGYLAIRYAAHDKRVKAAVAFAPVADLRQLKEFESAKTVPAVEAMSLEHFAEAVAGKPIWVYIGDRDDRVGTDSVIAFMRKLSAAALKANVPSNAALHVLSEPRGHSTPAGADLMAARWLFNVIEGRDLPNP